MNDTSLDERRLKLQEKREAIEAEIARARLELDRSQAGRFSTGAVTLIGALIAVVSAVTTTTISGYFDLETGAQDTAAQIELNSQEVLGQLDIKRTEVDGQIRVQELIAEAERDRLDIQQKFEIIVQATKGLPTSTASENLRFFVEAGILDDPAGRIRSLAEAGRAPDLPLPEQSSHLGGVIGKDDAQLLPGFDDSHPAQTIARSVGRLMIHHGRHDLNICTAFLITKNEVATAKHCVDFDYQKIVFELFPNGITGSINDAEKVSIEVSDEPPRFFRTDEEGGYAVLSLERSVDDSIEPINVDAGAGELGAALGTVYFRFGSELSAVWGASDCRIMSWNRDQLIHLCDTGPGTSGSPIIDLKSNAAIAVHVRRVDDGGLAYRLAE
jgi:hypothetical protein